LLDRLVVDRQVLGAVLLGLVGINLQHLGDEGFGLFTGQVRHF